MNNYQRYKLLAEHSSDVIYELDSQLHFTYISPAAKELFGYSIEDVNECSLFMAINTIVYSQDIERITEQIRARLNGSNTVEIDDFRIYTFSGDIKWVSVKAKYICDNEGRLQKIVGNCKSRQTITCGVRKSFNERYARIFSQLLCRQ